jgi:N-acyl-D-aspartate/D-glutamate deacylase
VPKPSHWRSGQLSGVSQVFAQGYDIVINNGWVMGPETMYDGVANVGIKDGLIVAITRDAITGLLQ